jgi:hypothetical protein
VMALIGVRAVRPHQVRRPTLDEIDFPDRSIDLGTARRRHAGCTPGLPASALARQGTSICCCPAAPPTNADRSAPTGLPGSSTACRPPRPASRGSDPEGGTSGQR